MKNILTKLANLWNRFTRESEDWEYFKYLRQHPDRAPFIEGKTKVELAQELHDWKVHSSEQARSLNFWIEFSKTQALVIYNLQSDILILDEIKKS
jgi:hypothetical protein